MYFAAPLVSFDGRLLARVGGLWFIEDILRIPEMLKTKVNHYPDWVAGVLSCNLMYSER